MKKSAKVRENEFNKEVTDIVFRHIDEMCAITPNDPAEKILSNFVKDVLPVINAFLEVERDMVTGEISEIRKS